MGADRALDTVLFGATGFVGRLTAEYLAAHAPDGIRIGLAGRSESRLASVREGLGPRASAWQLIVADAADPRAMAALAERTRVVATTVGPYRRYGFPLVEACAAAGTHYADLTGETLFVRETIDRYGAAAEANGARIVHSCGFDSIPSDLGVLLLHQAARADGAGDLGDTKLVATGLKGSVSGGTVATMKLQLEEMRSDRRLRRIVFDPYALSPDRSAEPDLGPERDVAGIRRDPDLNMWIGPFIMAGFNTRVVRRSNALQAWAYGRGFRYLEVMGFGTGLDAPVKAAGAAALFGSLGVGLGFAPTRALLDRVLPAPGQGPSERMRRTGFFRIEIHTRTSDGSRYVGRVAARGDPGYAATSVMLGESAISLAMDGDRLPAHAGVLTPATAMGMALVDRLRTAGMTFATERSP